jgi:hypothetical protein
MPYHDYASEAAELDTAVANCISQRQVPGFNGLALRIFAHQLRYNAPYARYCATRGISGYAVPESWEEIPPVPSAAFKEAALCTFDPSQAALVFETSGTTVGIGGKHYLENATLYDAALLAGFYDAMLADLARPLRYLLLVPNPALRPQSSLGYMMRKVAAVYGDGREQWFLEGDALDVDGFEAAVQQAISDGAAVCLAGTAFAFVQLLDELRQRGRRFELRAGSRIMETGGFKGRTRAVERSELYEALAGAFSVPQNRIVAEYGMTELTSQYYDRVAAQDDNGVRVKVAPPWLRPRVVGPDGKTLPHGVVGALVHVDLGNRSSCVAIQTEDLGVATADGGIILLGREHSAELRGCSLDAEQLRTLTRR